MATVRESKGKAPEVAEGLYTFTIIKAETGVRQSDKYGKAGEPTLTVFCQLADIVDEDGDVIVLDPELSLKFSRGGKYQPSNLYLYAKAAGVLPDEGQDFETDWLVGKVLQGKVAPDEESGWPKIEPASLMPMKPKGIDFSKMKTPTEVAAERAAAVPSIINPDGSVNFDTFWKTLRAHNISRTEVVAQVNGDIENLMAMEAADVALLLESLLSVPF